MRCLKRNKRMVYLCVEYQDGDISKFREPISVNINYRVTNSDGELIALGRDFPKYIRMKTDLINKDLFHPKDRVYINVTPGETFDPLCKDADYEVDSDPIVSLNVVEITLSRLSGKE